MPETDGLHRSAEADFASGGAQGIDQVADQELLGIHVMVAAAQSGIVKQVGSAVSAELAGAQGLSPREHPFGQAVGLEKPGRAVLDQAGPGPGPHGLLVEAFEHQAVDPRPHQHVRRRTNRPGRRRRHPHRPPNQSHSQLWSPSPRAA